MTLLGFMVVGGVGSSQIISFFSFHHCLGIVGTVETSASSFSGSVWPWQVLLG
jgi:hypothetical protein